MRRRLAALLLPVAALSACATTGAPTPAVPEARVARAEPLRVRALDQRDGLWVRLNRPAYTAIFQIVPGEGVALISPDFGERSLLQPGSNRILPAYFSSRSGRFWRYDDFQARRYSFASSALTIGPRHLMVVASERPLVLGRFSGAPGLLRRVLGTARYTSQNSQRVMDDVLAAVVPAQGDDSWDVDVVTVWPDDGGARLPAGQLYLFRCQGGQSVWVPLELAAAACRDLRSVTAPPARTPDETPRDSSGVREPDKRRPRPEPEGTDRRPRETDAGEAERSRLRIAELRERLQEERRERGARGASDTWNVSSPSARIAERLEQMERGNTGRGTTRADAATPRERPQRPETRTGAVEPANRPERAGGHRGAEGRGEGRGESEP